MAKRKWIRKSLLVLTGLFLMINLRPAGAEDWRWFHYGGYTYDKILTNWILREEWMGDIPGNRRLSELSILGTHDTMSLHPAYKCWISDKCYWAPVTQSNDLLQQLRAGIRLIDIRLRHEFDRFRIFHSAIYQYADFYDVLNTVVDFLRDHPTETVLMYIEQTNTPWCVTRSFDETFAWYLDEFYQGVQYKDWVWEPTSVNPTLDEVRGKIVILDRFSEHGETVDSGGDMGEYTSLALDENDQPHISFYEAALGDLKYVYKPEGGDWEYHTVDSGGNVGQYTSLELGKDALDHPQPHISYYDATNGDLKYAKYVSSGGNCGSYNDWLCETVDSGGNMGKYSSLALDTAGNPHISYYDATNGDLKYAKYVGSGGNCGPNNDWSCETVDYGLAGADVGQYSSIALDSSDIPHISYYNATDHDLKYAYSMGENWWFAPVDSGSGNYVGQYTSLALDDNGNPHISYYDAPRRHIEPNYERDLKYIYFDGSTWKMEEVDTQQDVGRYSSLALEHVENDDDIRHISFYDVENGDLKYSVWNGNGWNTQTVDEGNVGADVGRYSSLALDTAGNPHISYYDATQKVPIYAQPTGNLEEGYEWIFYTLGDPRNVVGQRTSLALGVDAQGNPQPHISYVDYSDNNLKYAKYIGSGGNCGMNEDWSCVTIDSVGDYNFPTSLALGVDAQGNPQPHIIYKDNTDYSLKYAKYVGSDGNCGPNNDWSCETVDYVGIIYGYALALDKMGNPHISYWDYNDFDLRYARLTGNGWITQTVSAYGGGYSSIALDEQDNPHISFIDRQYYLWYAKYVSSGGNCGPTTHWYCEPVDAQAGVKGTFNSLALGVDAQGNPQPHISYSRAFSHDLMYAYSMGENWWFAPVDSESNDKTTEARYISLALDDNDNPHIGYYDESVGDLKYTYRNGGKWFVQAVDHSGHVGYFSSLALGVDAQGNPQPHFSYYDLTNLSLKYAGPSHVCGAGVTVFTKFGLKSGEPCQLTQGQWYVPEEEDLFWKWDLIEDQLVLADEGDPEKFYMNALSGAGKFEILDPVLPYFVASGHDNELPGDLHDDGDHRNTSYTCVENGEGDDGCDAWDPWPYINCDAEGVCEVYYTGTNELTTRYLWLNPARDRARRWGMIMADFPGPDLIDAIIGSNFPEPMIYLPVVLR